jgi:hypothetical protein
VESNTILFPNVGGVIPWKITLVKLVQPANTLLPIVVTPLPMVTFVKLVQFENAKLSINVTLLGMTILVKPVQRENAPPPMTLTLLGMVTLVKPVRLLNTPPPMPSVSALKVKLPVKVPLNPITHLSA